MKKVCAHWVLRDLTPKQKTEGCRIARSCSLFIRRTQRNSLPDWLQMMSPEDNTFIGNMITVLVQTNFREHVLLESRWPQYSGIWRASF